jgi:hypothetical protein
MKVFPPADAYLKEPVPIDIEYKGTRFTGKAVPLRSSCHDGVCFELDVTLNGTPMGTIHCTRGGWRMDHQADPGLVNAIGEEIFLWYE